MVGIWIRFKVRVLKNAFFLHRKEFLKNPYYFVDLRNIQRSLIFCFILFYISYDINIYSKSDS